MFSNPFTEAPTRSAYVCVTAAASELVNYVSGY